MPRSLRLFSRQGIGFRTPLFILTVIVFAGLLAPVLALHDPRHTVTGAYLQPPSPEHPFGTDTLGRDVYGRTLWGGRQTLGIALLGTAISVLPGLVIGVIAGFYNRWLDRLLMAAMDVLLAFPNLLLALALLSLLGSGAPQVALAVGIAGLPAFARVARTATLTVRAHLYIEAAQAIGARQLRTILWHILPNILGTLLSFAAVSLSWAVLNSAALVFLGFGGDPATPEWGAMLYEGRSVFRVAPWIAVPPGLAITLTVYAITRLADGWQDRQHG